MTEPFEIQRDRLLSLLSKTWRWRQGVVLSTELPGHGRPRKESNLRPTLSTGLVSSSVSAYSIFSIQVETRETQRVSPGSLGNHYILDLSGCTNIKDVSTLGNVYNLNLSECNGITDVSMLYNVCYLNVDNCEGITDTIALSKSKEYKYTDEI